MSKAKPHQKSFLTPTGRVKGKTIQVYMPGRQAGKTEALRHRSTFIHDGKMYDLVEVSAADSARFPKTWPGPGWYWEEGVPGTIIVNKRGGPFKTANAAKLDIGRH